MMTKLRHLLHSIHGQLIVLLSTFAIGQPAMAAFEQFDITQDQGGDRNLHSIAGNIDGAVKTGVGLGISVFTAFGFLIVALSLFQIYKASKDEREKPTSAVVGLFIGGAMAAVGTIVWIMRNTVIDG